MRELKRGLVMGLIISAVPAGALGVYWCFASDMPEVGVALGVGVALAEMAFGLWMSKGRFKRIWRAMPTVGLWALIGYLGFISVMSFGEDWATSTMAGLLALALAYPLTRRLLGRLVRWPGVLLLAVMLCFGPFGGSFGKWWGGIGVIMAIQLAILDLLQAWDRRTTPAWRKEFRYPKGYGGSRSGATLVTAIVAMMLVAMCLTATMQAYMEGGRAREVQARRVSATAACREVVEGARAQGYGRLKAVGEYSFGVQARQPMSGLLQIANGPVPESKLVTATVTWAADERGPAGSARLSTILSARGIGG